LLNFLDALFGGTLLIAGRKLSWLFVGVIGFIIGAQIATRFFHGSELITIIAGIIFVLGGIIGAALIALLFDWALIIISSLAGSSMVLNAFHFANLMSALMFIVLLFIGIAIQASALRTDRRTGHKYA
jgi:hypothetical protein